MFFYCPLESCKNTVPSTLPDILRKSLGGTMFFYCPLVSCKSIVPSTLPNILRKSLGGTMFLYCLVESCKNTVPSTLQNILRLKKQNGRDNVLLLPFGTLYNRVLSHPPFKTYCKEHWWDNVLFPPPTLFWNPTGTLSYPPFETSYKDLGWDDILLSFPPFEILKGYCPTHPFLKSSKARLYFLSHPLFLSDGISI